MMRFFSTLFLISALTYSYAQKAELTFSANSGLSYFRGETAANATFMNYNQITRTGYTNNPYGSRTALCYGASILLQRASQKNLVTGLELGYESLRSRITLNEISIYDGISTTSYAATGHTNLNSTFLSLNTFVGHRFNLKVLTMDMLGGFELGYCYGIREKATLTANGNSYDTSFKRTKIEGDARLRAQINVSYKRAGAYLGYSLGLTNYLVGYVGGKNEAFINYIRFGLRYRII